MTRTQQRRESRTALECLPPFHGHIRTRCLLVALRCLGASVTAGHDRDRPVLYDACSRFRASYVVPIICVLFHIAIPTVN